ncbi:MAG: tRNA (adenosine(37)-N6)-threonylcarbamoyltransferase complex ATPase subunit type 1 TsaE [SAR202 cluster bacterium]|nr:tRNA (adenosine(37)-N6)-threonylcarbamoyltransferase complex ATPase subunit type 1 TsaE [SAR202 cluster bacterium]
MRLDVDAFTYPLQGDLRPFRAKVRIETISNSPEETQRLGEILGAGARPGDIFLLTGRLGAGKTALTQGIVRGTGSPDIARSPTFVLVTEYAGRLPVYHMDLYRLGSAMDVLDIGVEEYLNGDGLCVIEWADKAKNVFPQEHLSIAIDYISDTVRRVVLSSESESYSQLLNTVQAQLERSRANGA